MRIHDTSREPLKWIVAWIALASGLLPAGCNKTDGKQTAAPIAQEVATVTVRPQQAVLTTELPGRTSAYRIAEVRPQVNGIVQKRLFVEGSEVKAGQLLYQIDPAPFRAALENAMAALGKAEANLPALRSKAERYKEALVDKAVSQQDYDDAASAMKQSEADIQSWKAMVDAARINLGYTRITAPISGRIGKSNVTEGALATAHQATALTTIQQMDPIHVDVFQATAELLRLKRRLEDRRLTTTGSKQNKVKLLLEDGSAYPMEGTLQFRDVSVDPTTGSVILRIVFPNPKGTLLPGMYVRAVVTEGVNEKAILIPQQAVARDPKGNPMTLIVDGSGKVTQRMLNLDRAIGDKWLVTSGVAPGDRVIVEGMQKVRPGASVKEVPFDAGGEPGAKSKSPTRPAGGTSGGK